MCTISPTSIALAACFLVTSGAHAEEVLEFNKHIRPILSENCYACHGPDKNARKADLRLDIRAEALKENDGRTPIVPGDSSKSELYARIIHQDPDEKMPPAKFHKHLTTAQIETLKKWIDQGAEYQAHWSYIAPKKITPAPVGEFTQPVDALIAAELQPLGLTISPIADKATLVRRLHTDLLGLPPKPEVIEAVVSGQKSIEQLIDELLASPHFGERLAMGWLDVARYADTVGYHGDQDVSVSPYRDYVIKSFNENKKYDVFTRENLAGDLLPNPTEEQKVASGFNRLNMTTEEGGSQPKEYLTKYASDRVRTTSTIWMGATLGCAQCHDHKFDPYTTRDFYAMAAFFADIDEKGVYGGDGRPPMMKVAGPNQRTKVGEIEQKIAQLQKQLETSDPAFTEAQAKWETASLEAITKDEIRELALVDDDPPGGGEVTPGWNLITAGQGEIHKGGKARKQEAGGLVQHFYRNSPAPYTMSGGEILYAWVFIAAAKPPQTVMLQVHSPDGEWDHRAFWGEDKIPYGKIGQNTPAHKSMGALPKAGEWVQLAVNASDIGLKPGQVVNGLAFTQHGGLVYWDDAGVKTSAAKSTPEPVLTALKTAPEKRTPAQVEALTNHFKSNSPEFKGIRDQMTALQKERDQLSQSGTSTLITVSVKPRDTRVLPRGNWMDESGDLVEPAVPVVFVPTPPKEKRLTRLDLANWLVSRENPLTARVFINRLWKQFFGTGLSKQLDELGSQGEWPRHMELLDWLAVEFMESGWDIKHIVKLIVSSRAYQQGSTATAAQRETDPDARLLARQARFRMDAELVRDAVLSVAGILELELGGVSAKPYQPPGYYAQLNFPTREYQPDNNNNQWRRGVYTHWQRTFLHPMLLAFDAPSRDECTADRNRSNTPLQALVLLNDPTFVEAARVFAARIMQEGGSDTPKRLDWAFRQALGRTCSEAEAPLLTKLLEQESARFQQDPKAAQESLKVGLKPVPANLPAPELAAWCQVARAIFNLSDLVTRQ